VLEALAAGLEYRSVAELAERIARNWEHWRWRLAAGEPIRDPVALQSGSRAAAWIARMLGKRTVTSSTWTPRAKPAP
jgi:hypothetical protein